jgi:glycosyltransferase involved in cell wall biosynthesis
MSAPILLVLGYVWPEPNSSAAGSHMLSLVQSFVAKGYRVTFASPAQQGEHKFSLQSIGVTEASININDDNFDTFVTELNPDVVLYDRFMLEEQFGWRVTKHCPHALTLLDTEDLHSLRHARHSAFKQGRQVLDSDLCSDLAKREIAAIYRCDLSLIISDYEFSLLTSHFKVPEHILMHCPFMLDVNSNNPSLLAYEQRQHFISIGNFRHAPNWDAVLWLKQQIWPYIRAQLPKAELHIYGAYPPPKATQLHNTSQGFLVKGWAEDAKLVMGQARVCLAPLRFGAGIKGKLAEAMQSGTPNVTTNLGKEGMTMGAPWPGEVIDIDYSGPMEAYAQDFAKHAVNLYQNKNSWVENQQKGYALLNQNFNKGQIESSLHRKIAEIRGDISAHRAANFTGLMLHHHTLKSTQYMSQWITEKNRNN